MLEVNVRDARSNLSALLEGVEAGEEIIIKHRGKRSLGSFPFIGSNGSF
jgi:antitoxin (DNA-binding transcriptional repressor) of toxin-antitoxin stability system